MIDENVVYDTRLSRKEEAIIRALWSAKRPLAKSELVAYAAGMGVKLNLNSTQIMINNLLAKNLIRVNGMKLIGTIYARQFEPTLTPEELTGLRVQKSLQTGMLSKISGLIAYLVENEPLSNGEIEELERMLHEQKDKE